VIHVHSLTVAFGRTVALDGIDLDIAPGIIGLFGPNGSGKTTLLRVVAGLLRPTEGTVTIENRAVELRDESFRRRVGYAGHAAGLYAHLTLAENLALFAKLYGTPPERADHWLEAVGLQHRAATRAADLSAGLKRRAAVARALLHDPDVLLLDEPYANLDDDAAEMVSSAVRSWRRDGRVALIATHGAKKVKAYADGGIILRDGRVVVSGLYKTRSPVEVETS
jgi:heme ABC exporter ATP-binding subunit CcmA